MNALDTLTEINVGQFSAEEKIELLNQIRKEIDSVDDSLIELLNFRAGKYEILSMLKKQLDMNNYSPEREKEIIERIKNTGKENISSKDLSQIFERIIDVSRAIQKRAAEKE
jgi:chorismate mutase